MRQYYVYILASRPGGAIYVGVTSDLVKRVYEHKQGFVPGHTKQYRINKLVYFEQFSTAYEAIQRENRQAARLDPQDARQLEHLNPPIRRDLRRPRTEGL